jgi:hypothetical protein
MVQRRDRTSAFSGWRQRVSSAEDHYDRLPDEQMWSLHRQLAGEWAAEFKSAWREARQAGETRRCIVDLIEVIAIDRDGEAVLAEIMSQRVEFVDGDVDETSSREPA